MKSHSTRWYNIGKIPPTTTELLELIEALQKAIEIQSEQIELIIACLDKMDKRILDIEKSAEKRKGKI